ncbi:MAG: CPBP family intramembrane metalloprotease [Atopobiaceae bacterium]|nr:CPBP family intramembrane metalloprotease [Atopobiaceae bacterium]
MAKHAVASAERQTQVDLFRWELPGMDFPLYNDETLALWQPAVLILCAILAVTVPRFFTDDRVIKAAIMFFGTLVPFLILVRGDIGSIIKRPRWRDIPLVLIALVLTIVYSIGMGLLLSRMLGVQVQPNALYQEEKGALFYQAMLVQLFGEEMLKLDVLLGVMTLAYRWTDNRKTSVVLAAFATMFVFGIAHLAAYNGSILQILLVQGLGSIFDLFCYMRTKNVLTSYAMHVMLDFMFV